LSRRITITIPSLSLGGAEGVAAMMANHWAAEGDQVTLLTLDSAETDTFQLAPEVHRIALGLMRDSGNLLQALVNNRQRVQKLRAEIARSRPDVVISLTDRMNVLTLLAAGKATYPVIVSERSDPRYHLMGRVWSYLRKKTYPRAAAVVVQTQGVADFCRPWFPSTRIEVIPNAVPAPRSSGIPVVTEEIVKARPASHVVLGMGRLSHEKGFDMLIDAFSNLADDFPDWKLRILGEGPLRETLQATIDQRGLQAQIELPGWVADPELALDQGDLFVLPSRYEGFPNALLQAMSRGLPCIGFDCQGSLADLSMRELKALLLPTKNQRELTSIHALEDLMRSLMADEKSLKELALLSLQASEKFSIPRYFASWDQLIKESLTGRDK
jgi:glycosyltransferase involved in cell wall biosynthesis